MTQHENGRMNLSIGGVAGVASAISVVAVGTARAGTAAEPGRYQGVLGAAAYLIDVPRDWNGGLVMFAHG
jgi:hypothetical protein